MSISYPLTPPTTPGPVSVIWTARNNVGMTESDFTFQSQSFEWQAEMWQVEVTLPPMPRATAEAWVAFLTSLRGKLGSFFYGPAGSGRYPRQTATGTPLVNGASQTGKTLTSDGWSGVLRAGDWLQVNHTDYPRLYKCMTDVSAGGVIDIFPRLRTPSPADNAAIGFLSPVGTFRLMENNYQWDINSAQHYGIKFKAQEYI